MKQIAIHKAQRTLQDVEIPDTTIRIDMEIQDYDSLADSEKAYRLDAKTLCKALYNCLPGGTFDQLLVEMLKRKASLFKVIHR